MFLPNGQSTKPDYPEKLSKISKKWNNTTLSYIFVVKSSATNDFKQTPLDKKKVSGIIFAAIVLGCAGAILLFVHLLLSIKSVCNQNKII